MCCDDDDGVDDDDGCSGLEEGQSACDHDGDDGDGGAEDDDHEHRTGEHRVDDIHNTHDIRQLSL